MKKLALVLSLVGSVAVIGAQSPVTITPASAVNGAGVLPSGATVGGTLFTSTTAQATTGLVEETLQSYTLQASTLAVNGRGVRVTAWGTVAANANAKTYKLYFGSTVVFTQGGTSSATPWYASAVIMRSGATAQIAAGWGAFNAATGAVNATSPAETLSGTVLIKLTGTTPTTIGDLTANGLIVEAI